MPAVVHAAADKLPRQFGGGNGKDSGADVAADGNLVYPAEGDAAAANGVRYTPDTPATTESCRPNRVDQANLGQHGQPDGARRSNGPFDMTDLDLVVKFWPPTAEGRRRRHRRRRPSAVQAR